MSRFIEILSLYSEQVVLATQIGDKKVQLTQAHAALELGLHRKNEHALFFDAESASARIATYSEELRKLNIKCHENRAKISSLIAVLAA